MRNAWIRAPRPVEIIFRQDSCSSPDTLHEMRQADVVIVDGARVDSPHALAAASANAVRPGTLVIGLNISFPESDFESLHYANWQTDNWGSPGVSVHVQRKRGSARPSSPPMMIPQKGNIRSGGGTTVAGGNSGQFWSGASSSGAQQPGESFWQRHHLVVQHISVSQRVAHTACALNHTPAPCVQRVASAHLVPHGNIPFGCEAATSGWHA